uniref:Uncharacterized protein n=1 Tax=Trichogramma kaykai TaxID=54128 RepID=A0ABD2VZY1_9HYME
MCSECTDCCCDSGKRHQANNNAATSSSVVVAEQPSSSATSVDNFRFACRHSSMIQLAAALRRGSLPYLPTGLNSPAEHVMAMLRVCAATITTLPKVEA